MNQSLIVRGTPQEYECRIGAWDGLEEHLTRRMIQRVMVLHGTDSWQAAAPYFPELNGVSVFLKTMAVSVPTNEHKS